jgi:hypothetical protein
VRVVSAALGTLTVPATYLLGRALYDRRAGLLAAAVLAITLFPLHVSRMGFRVVSVPFALGWFLWQFVRAWQTGRGWQWGLAGLLYGMSFHTYTAARVTPLALLVVGAYVAVRGEGRRLWPGVVWFGLGAALAVAPLAVYVADNPGEYFNRILHTAALGKGGGLGGALAQVLDTAGMFFVRGDPNPRHNVPGRPLFDPLLGAAFLLGLAALWRERRRTRGVFVAVWLAVGSLGTLLAVNPPHFLRALAMFPLLALVPALGLERAWAWLEARTARWRAALAIGVALAVSLALTLAAYLSPGYRLGEETAYHMEVPAVEMAMEVNQYLGVGWQGAGWRVEEAAPHGGRRVLMPESLWNFSETTRYLVPLEPGDSGPLRWLASPGDVPGEVGEGFKLLVAPGEWADYAAALPQGGLISARWGPVARADVGVDEEPFVVYAAYQVSPWEGSGSAPVGEFEAGMALLDYDLEVAEDRATVRLIWLARKAVETDYTLFVHVLGDGAMVGQEDGPIGGGLYSTDWWRPGDVVLEERVIPLEPGAKSGEISARIGFYLPENGERVPLIGGGDALVLAVE